MVRAAGLERIVEEMPGEETIGRMGHKVQHALHGAVLKGGEPARKVADALHGTWLGHPLHPVLTDITIEAWVMAGVFDVIAAATGDRRAAWAGDMLLGIGTAAAVPTALAGMADYSTAPKRASRDATVHGVLNAAVFGLNAASLAQRRRGACGVGRALSWAGLGLAAVSAWLGGRLVYRHKVGVDHSEQFGESARHWRAVMEESDLPERTPVRVEVEGKGVLLYREDGEVFAIGAVCAHAGGPLEQGKFEGGCVQCPWHQSVYDLRTGGIVHGPTTHPQPRFDTRVVDGRIEVRLMSEREAERGTRIGAVEGGRRMPVTL